MKHGAISGAIQTLIARAAIQTLIARAAAIQTVIAVAALTSSASFLMTSAFRDGGPSIDGLPGESLFAVPEVHSSGSLHP